MSAEKQTGGPAFQITGEMRDGVFVIDENMTMRDHFAAMAMQGYLASLAPDVEPVEFASTIARDSYLIADEMLKAREV